MPPNRRHPVISNYFAIIDSPDKAYTLGFFMADGCIESTGVLSFVQHRADIAVLEFIRRELQGGHETYPFDTIPAGKRNSLTLQIACTEMVRDLTALGFGRRKSETCTFPHIDPTLQASLLLGIFDGDGSIYSALHKRYINRTWALDWTGTLAVLTAIRCILARECQANPDLAIRRVKNQCHCLIYNGNDLIERIGHFLYERNPPSFFLPRKRARFQELFDRPAAAPHAFALRTHCVNGHEYTVGTTYRDPNTGRRGCRTCRTLAQRRYRARQAQAG